MKYGFIGVGNMGHFMAANCMKAGYEMVVSNTHAKEAVAELAKQGAETVDTNGQVAEKAEIIFLCLPNGDVVESVIEELLDAENSIVKEIYDFSTIAPTTSQKLGKEGKENGYKYYDCPIAGGVAGAEAATLSIMVGCDESEFDHVKEVVAPMGKNIMYAGVTGSGSAVKMFNNYLGGSGLVACCEVMVMAKKLGIDVENVFNIINKSTGRNFASETSIIPFLKERDFSPKFATDLFYKDINIAMETAAELKMSVPIGAATLEAFGAARAMGCGKEHSIAVVKYYEALAGVKVN